MQMQINPTFTNTSYLCLHWPNTTLILFRCCKYSCKEANIFQVSTRKSGKCECIATWRPPDESSVFLGCYWQNL